MDAESTVDRRLIAATLELTPFVSLVAFTAGTNAAFAAMAFVLVSGLGWLSAGRWREAVAIFTTRLAVLIFAGPFALLWLFAVGLGCSPSCSTVDTVVGGGPMLIILGVAYLVPLWSAAMALRGKPLIRA